MKYIRTKDGIYEKTKHAYAYWGNLNEDKEADTIEELCDEFVIVGKNNEGIQFWKDLNALKECSGYFVTKDFSNVYGAIWTAKGLIYVAKMNDKGELKLI